MTNIILVGLIFGAWGALWAGPLTFGGLFSFVPSAYWKATNGGNVAHDGWRAFIAKPLFDCSICHAGQVAFWAFLIFAPQYDLFHHFTIVVVAMASSGVITKSL